MNHNKMLSILLTHRCNMECEFCYVNAENSPAHQESGLSLMQWQMVLKEARTLGYSNLHIFGGEPFLSSQLPDLCKIAVKMGYQLLIATNGTAFQDSDRSWILALRDSLQISFTINEINLSWAQLAPIKKKWLEFLAENHIITTIVTCLTTKNIASYKTFLYEFTTLGKTRWGFFGIYYSPIGRGQEHFDYIISPDQWITTIKELTARFPVRIEQAFYPQEENDDIPMCPKMCPMVSQEFLTIDYNGHMYPCFLCCSNKNWTLGIWDTEGDFKEISLRLNMEWIQNKLASIYHMTSQESYQEIMKGSCPVYIIKKSDDILTDFRNRITTKSKDRILICPLFALP